MMYKQTIYALSITLFGLGLVSSLSTSSFEPEVFDDNHLPGNPCSAGEVEQHQVLGCVQKPPTFLNYKERLKISTVFDICTRKDGLNDIDFKTEGSSKYPLPIQKMSDSGFDSNKRTFVIISGFLTKKHEEWMLAMRDTILRIEDANVILVSWDESNKFLYDRAVANSPVVARHITIFLHYLAQLSNTSLKDEQFLKRIHFIGHSMGAHISGFVGHDLNGLLGKITGLDPAGPSFDKFGPEWRLDPSDALLVEVYHTNMGKMYYMNAAASGLLKLLGKAVKKTPGLKDWAETISKGYSGDGNTAWFGLEAQVGDIDYYVNNGKTQPGCGGILHVCDHGRAYDVYLSILNFYHMGIKNTEMTKEDRLLAFASNESLDFLTGGSFSDTCFQLLSQNKEDVSRAIRKCAIPIDPLADVDEFRRELREEFGLKISGNSLSNVNTGLNPRFYFKTRSNHPYVGDHYLLKIIVDSDLHWTNECALTAVIEQQESKFVRVNTTIKLNKNIMIHKGQTKENFLAIPFIPPTGASMHYVSKKAIKQTNEIDQVRNFFEPDKIFLHLTESDATGIMESAAKTVSWRKKVNCYLLIKDLEIRSVRPDMVHVTEYYLKDSFSVSGTKTFLNSRIDKYQSKVYSVKQTSIDGKSLDYYQKLSPNNNDEGYSSQ